MRTLLLTLAIGIAMTPGGASAGPRHQAAYAGIATMRQRMKRWEDVVGGEDGQWQSKSTPRLSSYEAKTMRESASAPDGTWREALRVEERELSHDNRLTTVKDRFAYGFSNPWLLETRSSYHVATRAAGEVARDKATLSAIERVHFLLPGIQLRLGRKRATSTKGGERVITSDRRTVELILADHVLRLPLTRR